jgi:hypothetical protein
MSVSLLKYIVNLAQLNNEQDFVTLIYCRYIFVSLTVIQSTTFYFMYMNVLNIIRLRGNIKMICYNLLSMKYRLRG